MAKNQWRLTGGSRYEEEQHQGRLVRCRYDLPHYLLQPPSRWKWGKWKGDVFPSLPFIISRSSNLSAASQKGVSFVALSSNTDPDRTYFWTRGFPQQHVRWCANIPWMFMLHIILDGNVSVKLAKYFWLTLILPAEFNSSVWEQQRSLSKYLLKHPWRHIFAPWG